MNLDVFALPELAPRDGYDIFLCIDVLRATTTITAALSAGAERVIPFADVDETFAAREELLKRYSFMTGNILLGGERKGLPIKGFDLGNSPDLYRPEQVSGKTLLFTTTNGTKTILHSAGTDSFRSSLSDAKKDSPADHDKEKKGAGRESGEIRLASFLNAKALADYVSASSFERIAILCAGTEGKYTEEDLLLAGRLVDLLAMNSDYRRNFQAEDVLERWRKLTVQSIEKSGREVDPDLLLDALESSRGGQNLVRLGLKKDIAFAAKMDSCPILPIYRRGEIVLK